VTSLTKPFHQVQYTVTTDIFEGPLDLLLQLIERTELDITRLALARVTDQYLAHLKQLENRPADEVSAFIVIASKLVQIKSEALLPRPPVREVGEEDPGISLAQQLRLYRLFKNSAVFLQNRSELGFRTFLRLAPNPTIEARLDLSGLTVDDLVFAAYEVFERQPPRQQLGTVVSAPRVTIREKISQILAEIKNRGRATFRGMVSNVGSRLEVVVAFLAMLELVKRNFLVAEQTELFGDIALELDQSSADLDDIDDDFELEFGE
jgi:segregation and condensation protein A